VFTSRDEAKGQKALAEINDYLKQQITDDGTFAGKVFMASLDLCDLDNVKSFKDRLINVIGKDQKIDVLLNNAGVSEYT
jgi:NAD(P)-dependent dehydrogenase (short-subunit alcohol dehydrogenase family)